MPLLFLRADLLSKVKDALEILPDLPEELNPDLSTTLDLFVQCFMEMLSGRDAHRRQASQYERRSRGECLHRHVAPAISERPGQTTSDSEDIERELSIDEPLGSASPLGEQKGHTVESCYLASLCREDPTLGDPHRSIRFGFESGVDEHLFRHLLAGLPEDPDPSTRDFIARWQGLNYSLRTALTGPQLHDEAGQMTAAWLCIGRMANEFKSDCNNW